MHKARKLVSKQKRRYTDDGFDLDLSYIGESRLIAMGFPSESIESAYRNPYKEVKRFLDTKHKGHYMVYNLCSEKDRQYSPAKFHDMVACFPFEDHNPPPFGMIEKFCEHVNEFLTKDQENVAAIHCKAGKGRTGTMIICHLLYTKFYIYPKQAQDFYAAMRTSNQKGLTIPSQIRYVNYFAQTVGNAVKPVLDYPAPTLFLKKVVMSPLPKLAHLKTTKFKLDCNRKTIFNFKGEVEVVKNKKRQKGDEIKEQVVIVLDPIPIVGDIKMIFTHNNNKFFHFWYNTAFIRNLHLTLKKHEIDGPNKDKKQKIFTNDFQIDLYFDAQDTSIPLLSECGIILEKDEINLCKTKSFQQEKDGRFVLSPMDIPFCQNSQEDNIDCVKVSIKALRSIVEVFKSECGDGKLTQEITKKITNKQEYKDFLNILKEYQLITFNYLTQENFSVFWINTFHVMMLHSLIEYFPQNFKERNMMMKTSTYYINGKYYTLCEVEQSIIRASLSNPSIEFPQPPKFSNKDERLNYILQADPRLNFCLSYLQPFSPPLRLFALKDFPRQIQECTTYFLDKNVEIQVNTKTIIISGFTRCFSKDFGKNDKSIIDFLKTNMSTKDSEKLTHDFTIKYEEEIEKKFEWKDYLIEEFPSDYVLSKSIIISEVKKIEPPPMDENPNIENPTTEVDDYESTTEEDN